MLFKLFLSHWLWIDIIQAIIISLFGIIIQSLKATIPIWLESSREGDYGCRGAKMQMVFFFFGAQVFLAFRFWVSAFSP
jgi:hypothetical protein